MKPLRQISDEMRERTTDEDYERAHIEADKLLIETLAALAVYAPELDQPVVDQIIADYGDVGKWYA